MAITEFILGRKKRQTIIDTLVVDATISLVTTLDATPSEFPVENNEDISDNIKLGRVSLTMDCFISNAPIGGLDNTKRAVAQGVLSGGLSQLASNSNIGGASNIGTGIGAFAGARLGGALGQFYAGEQLDPSYPQKAFKILEQAWRARKPFTIRTFFFPNEGPSNIYSNMAITNLTVNQTAESGDGLRFSLACSSMRIVTLQTGKVSAQFVKGEQAATSASEKKDLARQGTVEAKPALEEQSSILKNAFSFFGGG